MAGKRLFVHTIVGGLMATAAVAGLAVPAAAGVPVGDIGIRSSLPGPMDSVDMADFLGNDVYTETGAGQTIKKQAKPGKERAWAWLFENDGDTGDLTVKSNGTSGCFKVRHRIKDTMDITDVVVAGVTDEFDPGVAGDWIALRIKAKSCAVAGDVFKVKVDVSPSEQDFDRIKAKLKVV